MKSSDNKITLKTFMESYFLIPRKSILNAVLRADAKKDSQDNPFLSQALLNEDGFIYADEELFLNWLLKNLPLRVTYRYLESIGKF